MVIVIAWVLVMISVIAYGLAVHAFVESFRLIPLGWRAGGSDHRHPHRVLMRAMQNCWLRMSGGLAVATGSALLLLTLR